MLCIHHFYRHFSVLLSYFVLITSYLLKKTKNNINFLRNLNIFYNGGIVIGTEYLVPNYIF